MAATPLVEVRLYEPGQGDPYVIEHGLAYYEPLNSSWPHGMFSVNSRGASLLQYIEGAGLVCRRFLLWQDTKAGHYIANNGLWEQRLPAIGGTGRTLRLVQYDTTPDVEWSAQSTFLLPEDPCFAFTLQVAGVPPDHNDETYPPFVRVEWGGVWGIHFDRSQGVRLASYIDGVWQAAADLPGSGGDFWGGEAGETTCFVVWQRGKLFVSFDFGRSYAEYANPDASAIEVAAGVVTLRGTGVACAFGLHQLICYQGAWTAPYRNSFTPRLLGIFGTITGRTYEPGSTGVSFADVSDPVAGLARWQATLTPAIEPGTPWAHYRSPELYAGQFRYPVATSTPSGAYTTPWAGQIYEVVVDKPFALHEGGATIHLDRSAATQLAGNYRYRRVDIRLGWRQDDASETWTHVFTGHIEKMEPAYDSVGRVTVAVRCVNLADWFKRARWGWLDRIPLGGQSVNAAADYILYSEGLGAGYRSWHAKGDWVTLPEGLAEDPLEWPARGEPKWETLERIFGHAGLEVGVTDAGILATVYRDYVANAVTHNFIANAASPATPIEALIEKLHHSLDYSESATSVEVTDTTEQGTAALAWAADLAAEQDPTSLRFVGRRQPVIEDLRGGAPPWLLQSRAGAIAAEVFALKSEPDLTTFVDYVRQRRERVAFWGCAAAGIPQGTQAVILSLSYRVRMDPDTGEFEARNTAGVRLL